MFFCGLDRGQHLEHILFRVPLWGKYGRRPLAVILRHSAPLFGCCRLEVRSPAYLLQSPEALGNPAEPISDLVGNQRKEAPSKRQQVRGKQLPKKKRALSRRSRVNFQVGTSRLAFLLGTVALVYFIWLQPALNPVLPVLPGHQETLFSRGLHRD